MVNTPTPISNKESIIKENEDIQDSIKNKVNKIIRFTDKQLQMQNERIKSDYYLIEKWAYYVQNINDMEPRLEVGEKQIDNIKKMCDDDIREKKILENEKITKEIIDDVLVLMEKIEVIKFPSGEINRFNSDPLYLTSNELWLKRSILRLDYQVLAGYYLKINSYKKILIWCKDWNNTRLDCNISIDSIDLSKINKKEREEIINAFFKNVKKTINEYKTAYNLV